MSDDLDPTRFSVLAHRVITKGTPLTPDDPILGQLSDGRRQSLCNMLSWQADAFDREERTVPPVITDSLAVLAEMGITPQTKETSPAPVGSGRGR